MPASLIICIVSDTVVHTTPNMHELVAAFLLVHFVVCNRPGVNMSDVSKSVVIGSSMSTVQAIREQAANKEHNIQEEESGAVGTSR